MRPSFTVVLATKDRPAWAREALASLRAQTLPPLEILIVDDGSAPDAARELDALEGGGARVLRPARRGLSAARNSAASVARGEAVAFLDDDALAEPSWLEALGARLAAGALGAGGPAVALWESPPPAWLLGSRKARSYLGVFDLGGEARPLSGFHDFLIGTNCAFRREVFDAGHRFIELPWGRPTGGGDLEFSRRVMLLGAVWWEPAAVVLHRIPARKWRAGRLAATAFDYGMKKVLIKRPLSPRGARDLIGVDGFISAFSALGYAAGLARRAWERVRFVDTPASTCYTALRRDSNHLRGKKHADSRPRR